jgi:hypothetical protein
MTYCTRCHRKLTREPVIIDGHGYGPVWSVKLGWSDRDLLTPAPRQTARKPRRKGETRQMMLEAVAA